MKLLVNVLSLNIEMYGHVLYAIGSKLQYDTV